VGFEGVAVGINRSNDTILHWFVVFCVIEGTDGGT
jgi:hypothetical protein